MGKIILPPVPAAQAEYPVAVWAEPVEIETYAPASPDAEPMFLERRVYQGSSGAAYPLPFYSRISDTKSPVSWEAVHLENRYVRLMLLPGIGGRVHIALDKTNGYDFVYRNNVIKPALVGLAGPWISGGIEFNWPQHHRPATFMPTEWEIEEEPDGSRTVWMGDHDPLSGLKGMHGIRLSPGSSVVELKARLYNRTDSTKTFLWWANVAARVHERYQSFFPSDVRFIADHAKRATSSFPLCGGTYYGVDYERRAKEGVPTDEVPACFVPDGSYAPNDLSWYANIPVPTSYMATGSEEDFFGGYDHAAEAGIVHIADHRIAPGKKQWTWGNHQFGYAWDRNLTDEDGPYIELMAGVFTDNQPDFSFLVPGETKTFSQYWYPIRGIGPALGASVEGAVGMKRIGASWRVGVYLTREIRGAAIRIVWESGEDTALVADIAPDSPFIQEIDAARLGAWRSVAVHDSSETLLVAAYAAALGPKKAPFPATEPPPPGEIASADELYVTGLHLDQYRHATRSPVPYWEEALRRDPGDSRCNLMLGTWRYHRGEYEEAERHFRTSIARLTLRNPNPRDGEAFYGLGLTLIRLGRYAEAYDAFGKAAWNRAFSAQARFQLARLDCREGLWKNAIFKLRASLAENPNDGRATALLAVALRRIGLGSEADALLRDYLAVDSLDVAVRYLSGVRLACASGARRDAALDMAAAGLYEEALGILKDAVPEPCSGSAPMLDYYRGYFLEAVADSSATNSSAALTSRAVECYAAAAGTDRSWCFPSRLQEIDILRAAIRARPDDANARYFLGNLFYDKRRYEDAIAMWEEAVALDPDNAIAYRNLGIAYFNVRRDSEAAREAYRRASEKAPGDARILYERDQLLKRLGEAPDARLTKFDENLALVFSRDDLCLEYCALLNQTGRHAEALQVLESRRFQPWEGGEGVALAQHARTRIALGREALDRGDARGAERRFREALGSPENLGEAWHLLANRSELRYWLGVALAAAGEEEAARREWEAAAAFRGDFQDMAVRRFSEATYWQALSLKRLGREEAAVVLLGDLEAYAKELQVAPAKIDYFATSLPAMLLFEENLTERQSVAALFLRAQARCGLGDQTEGARLLAETLSRDPNHAAARDFAAVVGIRINK